MERKSTYEPGLVSVITPLYNAKKYIGKTIESVLNQTYTNWEMVVVDDCSTDESVSIVQQYGDARIRLIRNEQNLGVAATRNVALKEARGQYVAFLDSDDIWCADKLSKQLVLMEETKSPFIYGSCVVMDEDGNALKKDRIVPAELDFKELLKGNQIPCLTVLIDRTRIKPFEMPKVFHEDYATWLSILRDNQIKAYGVQDIVARYRVSQNSLSGTKVRAAGWTWGIYRKYLGFSVFKSAYYFMWYAFRVVKKYS